MKGQVYWNEPGNAPTRRAVAALLGWVTHKGKLTTTGERIVKTQWEDLSPAVRNVLIRAGITQ